MPLTDTKIKNAKPQEKTYRLYDERGLYLEVSPKGGKWWRFKYRFRGKEKRVSLGTYTDTKTRGFNKAVVALANKLIRVAWVVIARGERYQPREALAQG